MKGWMMNLLESRMGTSHLLTLMSMDEVRFETS